jgi:hypothetical protein
MSVSLPIIEYLWIGLLALHTRLSSIGFVDEFIKWCFDWLLLMIFLSKTLLG